MNILLEKGLSIEITFPEDMTFGSLRPIKRGGKSDYFCRECYKETHDLQQSIIAIKTPHWTQSVYIDGLQESRQTTRLCTHHTKQWLSQKIPQELLDEANVSGEEYAELLLSHQDRITLDKKSLRNIYNVALIERGVQDD